MDWEDTLKNPGEYGKTPGYRVFRNNGKSTVVKTPEGVAKHFYPDGEDPWGITVRCMLSPGEPGLSPEGKVERYERLSGAEGKSFIFPEVKDEADIDRLEGQSILVEHLEGDYFSDLDIEKREDLAPDLSEAYRELQQRGISPRDWTPTNIVVQQDYNGGVRFGFVDLEYATDHSDVADYVFDTFGLFNQPKIPFKQV